LPHPFTKHAILSLVAQHGTAYGYQLGRDIDDWPISGPLVPSASTIYKSLVDLFDEHLLEQIDLDALPARSGRDRRRYAVTELGHQRVTEWMDTEPRSMEELWLRIGCARQQDIPALIRWVQRAENECLDRLESLGVPDLEPLVAGGAPWRLVTHAMLDSIETSQVEERSRLLREIRRALAQSVPAPPTS
jgi:DNA-binding PadR family transcriptional regulator